MELGEVFSIALSLFGEELLYALLVYITLSYSECHHIHLCSALCHGNCHPASFLPIVNTGGTVPCRW